MAADPAPPLPPSGARAGSRTSSETYVPPSSTSSSPGSIDGTLVRVMAWYANEWGFAHQMIREARCTLGVLDAR